MIPTTLSGWPPKRGARGGLHSSLGAISMPWRCCRRPSKPSLNVKRRHGCSRRSIAPDGSGGGRLEAQWIGVVDRWRCGHDGEQSRVCRSLHQSFQGLSCGIDKAHLSSGDIADSGVPVSVRLRRESRFCGCFTCQEGGDKTRCATSGTLPSHAVVVTQRYEALGTM